MMMINKYTIISILIYVIGMWWIDRIAIVELNYYDN